MYTEIREKLQRFLKDSGKSQKQAAREIGLSSAVISQFLAGVYSGDNSEVAAKVDKYLTMGKSRLNSVQAPAFFPTLQNTKQVLFAAAYAHKNNKISMVYGAAGAGKTAALKQYTKNNPGVIFVTANACSKNAKAILCMIAEALGRIPAGNVHVVMRGLVEMLKDTNRLIIIDEADHLTANALQAVRNLNDEAGVGLLLSGNDIIRNQMYSRGSLQFDQLRTRLACVKRVVSEYSLKEISDLFPALDKKSIERLRRVACKESLRTAINCYLFAAQCAVSQGNEVNEEYLQKAEVIQFEDMAPVF